MKKIIFLLTLFLLSTISVSAQKKFEKENKEIITMLNNFNMAAAKADYTAYFDFFDDESTFIGTDATEVWNKEEFMNWAKPYFENGKTWDFTSIKRNIYFSQDGQLAWFDELLNTQMKICRGSGVLQKIKGEWKVKQYVLSMTIPNQVVDQVVNVKTEIEDQLLEKLNSKK